jgi:hypothetical protein
MLLLRGSLDLMAIETIELRVLDLLRVIGAITLSARTWGHFILSLHHWVVDNRSDVESS